jgi:divalent metal cation (Fe/Co/Zn/Cd) transporter
MLRQILNSHLAPGGKPPLICSYHKLRHRHTGRYHWVDFHLMVPASMDVARGHEIASEIEGEIERALGQGDATAHVEPCGTSDCQHFVSTTDRTTDGGL